VTTVSAGPERPSAYPTWGWLDLLSSIPVIDVFRLGRVVRIVRQQRQPHQQSQPASYQRMHGAASWLVHVGRPGPLVRRSS
jgi:hypothetical protein